MNARNAMLVILALLLGACVRVGHIQQTVPVRLASFTGDHKVIAECIQRRIGGRVQDEGVGAKYVIYDSAKGRSDMTHWAITVARSAPGEGVAEWRVMRPAVQPGALGQSPGGARTGSLTPALSDQAEAMYWNPVLECIKQAKGS